MKKFLSILLIAVLLVTAMPLGAFELKASAASIIKSKDEAISWLKAQNGAWHDVDLSWGAQCADFASAYMNWLITGDPKGGAYGVYNANQYPTVASWDTTKWEVIANYPEFVPQPGDIFVSVGADSRYGHVGVVISSNSATATIIDQNYVNWNLEYGSNAVIHDITWAGAYSATHYIRPKFTSSIPLVTPTISFNKSSYTVGDTITVSWKASPSNSSLSHYWIVVTDPSGKEIIGEGVDKSKTSFSFTASSVGSYKVKVFATPGGSQSGEGSLTDTKSVTVNAKARVCKITYDANGGSLGSVPSSQTYTYATTGTTRLTYEIPTRGGYTFLGWSLSKTAASPSYSSGHLWQLSNGGDYTLYAVWERTKFQVSIRPAGGEIDGSTDEVVLNYTSGSVLTLPKPTRMGYDFVCWTLDYTGSNHILEPWGTPLHHDPSFSNSFSNISVYNNKKNDTVKIEKIERSSDCPTSSTNMLKISTVGMAHPDLGGFYQLTNSKKDGVFYHIIIAKIPVGYTINCAANSCGDGAKFTWLTSQEGTGKFETYIYKTECGSTGTFSTFGHVYISGKPASESDPLVWYVGYSEVFDGTGISGTTKYTVGTGAGILRAIWKIHKPHSCNVQCDKCKQDGIVTHTFDNDCDAECNLCGENRSVPEHSYDNDTDVDCNVCGKIRVITGTTGDCTWTLVGTELTISGNGAMGDYGNWSNLSPFEKGITKVIIKDGVTSIGNYAFYECTSLTSITIPNSVISIGDSAFFSCTNLTNITVPDSVKNIGDSAFCNCKSLTSITIPDSVTSIGGSAFLDCASLTSITIPDSVTSIEDLTFYNCDNLTNITIPGSVTSIGYSVFTDCDSLISISIPVRVTSIGDFAFAGCSSLTSITIPNSVTSIGHSVFYKCSSLTSITIPNSVTRINSSAFDYCDTLKNVYYRGSEGDKEKISIGSSNSSLTNATWYYNSCIGTVNHTYDSACDAICNICDDERDADHLYDNVCDTTCNECGITRQVPDHIYDNTCDTSCNVCGFIRSIEHTYSSVCDRDCNVCGEFRRAPHYYDGACDDTCNLCGNEREAEEHRFSNACDITCNECGATRTVPAHVYNNACDATCNVCGFERIPEEHKYLNACDKNCDVCGEERAITHTYAKECSTICDVCGEVRESVVEHTYANACDTDCNECGEARSTEHTYGNSCDTDCNVCGFIRKVEHSFTNECDGECDICYETRKAPHKYDGVCDAECNLCGKKRSVPEHSYGDDKVCDECGHKNFVLGDIDGTGIIDLTDVTVIANYMAGWDVECNEAALDVNGDGAVNLKDVVHLARYVAGWEGVVLR